MACKGFDGQVVRHENDLRSLLEKFVCVRRVQMRDVDLAQFQFDYDLTWSALFLHPDGTVFARYGSQTAEGPMASNSMAGLRNTLTRVLEAHAGYPANRERFRAKKGPPPEYRRAREIPSDRVKQILSREGRDGCVHCHNIYDGLHDAKIRKGTYDPEKLWKYPLPENLGLEIDPDSGHRIRAVRPGSFAARGGLKTGDVITALGGQAIFSIADIQFVLHFLPEKAKLEVEYSRSGKKGQTTLELEGDWRRTPITWRGSLWGMPPAPGLWVEDVDGRGKRELGLPAGKLGLKIRGVFGHQVRAAGLKAGDHIVEYDGRDADVTAAEFHAYLRFTHYRPGSLLKLTVLREGKRRKVDVRF